MSFLSVIKRIFGLSSKGDRRLVCEDCRKEFVFDAGEQEFFKIKGFTDPKRCPRCRKHVKSRMHRRPKRGGGGGGGGGGRRRGRGGRRRSIIDGNSPYQDE